MKSWVGVRHRRAFHVLVVAGIVMAASAAVAVSATEPNGGSSFDAGDDGWMTVEEQTHCSGVVTHDLLCDAKNERVANGGNPGGALRSQTTVIANGGGTFTADLVWRSPSFTVAVPPFEPSFAYDRRFDAQGLVALRPTAEVSVVLVDETAGTETLLFEDALAREDSEWDKRAVGVVAGVLNVGSVYHLQLRVAMRSHAAQADLRGSVAVLFDNVGLDLASRDGSTPGVTHPPGSGGEGSVSEGDITLLEGKFPGGSAIALRKCTVVGTHGDDKIRGTNGNDIICALGGDDKIAARKGFDAVDTGDGNDRADGGSKTDLLLGLAGDDRLEGSNGADRMGGGRGQDVIYGNAHNDKLWARDDARDRINGGGGVRDRAAVDRQDSVRAVAREKVK
jgi:Ca2+-binding RTX toxin-like protein